MSDKPNLFIGSAAEALAIAEQLQSNLRYNCNSQVWHQDAFAAGEYTLESLVNEAGKYDFAVMIFSAEDTIESRNASYNAPRDNVLFEMGLFVGLLGRTRTFMLVKEGSNVKIPSDLAGITPIQYRENDLGLSAMLGPAGVQLKQAFERLGKRSETQSHPGPQPPNQTPDMEVEKRIAEHKSIAGMDAPTSQPRKLA